MSDLNFGDCIGCGLCVLGCPAYEETGFDLLTARGRNKALQAGLAAEDMVEPIWACTLCGYCDAICPSDVHNVKIVLHLRRELAERRSSPSSPPQGRGRWSSDARSAIAPPTSSPRSKSSCGGSAVPPGPRTQGVAARSRWRPAARPPARVRAGVVADPVCLEQYDAEFLGLLAMQHLDLFELKPPFYYYAPHRIVNRDHARAYPLYDALRRRSAAT